MKRLNISCIALVSALGAPAGAEDIALDEIVITANQTETEKSKAGASVSTVSAVDLTGTKGVRGTSVLQKLPGVTVRTLGPIGTQAGLTIRGVPHTNVLVRVDGIDVTDPSGTQVTFDFGRLSFGDVSRAELARGAQSALYGSRANGGVISMTTRRATEEGVSQDAAIEAGSFNTLALTYGLGAKKGNSDVAFTLSHMQTDGYSAADENLGNTEADGYRADRISFAAGTELSNGLRLGLNGFYDDSWMEYDEDVLGVPTDGTPDDEETRLQKALRLSAGLTTGAVDHEFNATYFDSYRVLSGTNSFGAFLYNFRGTRTSLGYRGTGDLGGFGSATLGAERVAESYYDDTGFGSQEIDTTISSLYGELAMTPTGDLDIVVSGRVDDHSRYGAFTTGRVSANWRMAEDVTLRFNFGNAYRAPSNYELFDIYSGNAALEPETSKNIDLGIEKRFGDQGRIAATLFAVDATNLIDYSYTTFAYVQVAGTAKRRGLELEGSWAFDNGATLEGSYTYTRATTDVALDSSSWLATTPRHQLSLSLGAEIGAGWHGDVAMTHGAGRSGLPAFSVVDTGLSKDLGQGREAYLRIENLFNEQYQSIAGYGTADRSAFVGLRAKF